MTDRSDRMEQKMIFLDIDGTILMPGEGIRQTVRDGLRKARNKGHQIFICTGRSHSMLPEELQDMELDGIIASAGSDIWIHGQNVYRTSLDRELLERTMNILEEQRAVYVLEGFERVYVSELGAGILSGEEPVPEDNSELARWKAFFGSRKDVQSVKEWNPELEPIPKVTFFVWDQEAAENIRKRLETSFHVAFFPQKINNFLNGELISRTANKGTAVRLTARLLRQDHKNTVAFGDSMNDYQMIEQAACGIVMGNGDEDLKKIATRVCEPVEEDGVILELKRMGVI